MATGLTFQQPPKTGNGELDSFLSRLVGDIQRGFDDAGKVPRVGAVVSGVVVPTAFNATTATAAQTAQLAGALYNALKTAGKLS